MMPAGRNVDRSNFAATLPTLRKGHLVHRADYLAQATTLEVANFTINSFTRGVICFRQNMEITKANYHGQGHIWMPATILQPETGSWSSVTRKLPRR